MAESGVYGDGGGRAAVFGFSDGKNCQYGDEGIRQVVPGTDRGAKIRIFNQARFFSFALSSAASCRAASVAANILRRGLGGDGNFG